MISNPHVKKAYVKVGLTEHQMQEIIKCAGDPFYFIENYIKIQTKTKGSALFKLFDFQKRSLKGILDNYNIIILQPRQSGKSTLVIGYLLWETMFNYDKKVGIASHKGSGAKDLMQRIRYAYENIPEWMKPGVTSYNVLSIEFDNDSSIISTTTTESTFRGTSNSIIFLDELAFVKPTIAEEFWTSLLPSLSVMEEESENTERTKLIITSTPNGSEGLFADLWFKAEQGLNEFYPIRVYNDEIPGRGEKHKQEMLGIMSLEKYKQEFLCEFISTKGTLIFSTILESLRPSEPISEYFGLNLYQDIKDRNLAIGVDVGTGIGQDFSVIQIFDMETFEQIGEFRDNKMSITDFTKHLLKLFKYLKDNGVKQIYYTIESNSIGQGVINLINNSTNKILNEVDMISDKKGHGILMTPKSKMKGCALFKDLVESGRMKLHSRNLISELKFFVKHRTSFAAETGKNDDLVMGCILVTLLYNQLSNYEEVVYETLNTIDDIGDKSDEEYSKPLPIIV